MLFTIYTPDLNSNNLQLWFIINFFVNRVYLKQIDILCKKKIDCYFASSVVTLYFKSIWQYKNNLSFLNVLNWSVTILFQNVHLIFINTKPTRAYFLGRYMFITMISSKLRWYLTTWKLVKKNVLWVFVANLMIIFPMNKHSYRLV